MKLEARPLLKALLAGATLSTLFFYPLIDALASNPYYLHWQGRDSLELGLAGLALALLFGCGEWVVARRSSPRARLLGRLALLAVPLMSSISALLRGLDPDSVSARQLSGMVPVLGAGGLAAMVLATMSRRASSFLAAAVFRAMLVLSPVSLIFLWYILPLSGRTSPRVLSTEPAGSVRLERPAMATGVYVLVFDEFSYDFLYDEKAQIRESLSNLSSLARIATHYHHASSPGASTLPSLMGLLAARRDVPLRIAGRQLVEDTASGPAHPDLSGPSTLVGMARQRGFRTEVFGWYNPYCDLLAGAVDACRSVSMYNMASAGDHFAIWHPVATTVNMWPHQWPTGLAKNPVAVAYHRTMLRLFTDVAVSPVPDTRPVLRLVHFNIAHGPFLGDCGGIGCNPFDPSDANYLAQLSRVDEVIGTVRAALEEARAWDQSVIAVLSDHEFRRRTPAAEHTHVPLIVKLQAQMERADVQQDTRAETALADLVRTFRVGS